MDRVDSDTAAQGSAVRQAPQAARVRATLLASVVALGIAALVHLVRYVLLIINRNTLLNSVVAVAAVGLGVLASLAAIAAVSTCAILLTRWLIARRAAAFAHYGRSEPRPAWALWVGCLLPPSVALILAIAFAVTLAALGRPASWALMAGCVAICCLPLVAVVWALVYIIELAQTEQHYSRLRKSIWGWWLLWLLSSVTSVFATVTGGVQDAQGIANNTVAMIVAYLLALAAVIATARVFEGFERKPVERPAHRWVVVAEGGRSTSGSAPAVESAAEEPAAEEPAAEEPAAEEPAAEEPAA